MLKKAIKRALQTNHYWRDSNFDELSELYISNLLRSVALSIFMIFVPFYLYQNGYSTVAICVLFGSFFVVRSLSDIGSAYVVAKYGPKHTMIISCMFQIVSSALLVTVPTQHWHVVLLALPWAAAASSFFIAYHVSFSKIKHSSRAGHELGHMQTYEKVGFLLGPLIGGVVGTLFGAQYIFLVATFLLIASLWPLFQTSEPVKAHQKLTYKQLPIHKIKHDIFTNMCLGVENTLCINAWAFYVAVFVLSGAVYAQLGILSAAGVLVAIISAKAIGRLSDTSLARTVLRTSAVLNGLLYFVRPFVSGVWGVFTVNALNEALTAGYRMPFMKGVYTAADDLPGLRIVYLSSLEATGSIAKATVWFFLAILATVFTLHAVLIVAFAIAGLASFGLTRERFAVYNEHK